MRLRFLFGGALVLALALTATGGGLGGHAAAATPSPDVDSVSPNYANNGAQPPVVISGVGFQTFNGSPVTVTAVKFGTVSVVASSCPGGSIPSGGCFGVVNDTTIWAFPPATHIPNSVHVNVVASAGNCATPPCTSGDTSENLFVFTPFNALETGDVFGGVHGVSSPSPAGTPNFGFNIARGLALLPVTAGSAPAGYVLDGWGALHPFGGAPVIGGTPTPYFQGFDIARQVVLTSSGTGGYILDGFGAIHNFGSAPNVTGETGYWNFDIAKKMVFITATSGYVLDGYGGIWPFGGAPHISQSAYWGWNIARDIVMTSSTAGYVLDGYGGVNPIGTAGAVSGAPYFGFDIARGLVMETSSSGYTLDGYGGVHAFGSGTSAPSVQASYYTAYNDNTHQIQGE